ncbi:MAG: ABC transporter substrate-binding protein [Romboutsia sp.]
MLIKKRLATLAVAALLLSTGLVGCSSSGDGASSGGGKADAYDVLANQNARIAIQYAIDKQQICDVLLANGSFPSNVFTPSGLAINEGKDYTELTKGIGYTPDDAKAKEAWDKAKEEVGFDTVDFEILTFDSETSVKMAEFMQAELQSALDGANVTIKQQPFKQKLETEKNGDFQLSVAGWSADYPDPLTFLDIMMTGKQYANQVGYSSPEYDKLIEEAKSATSIDESWAKYAEAEKVMIEDGFMAPIYQKSVSYLEPDYVKDLIRQPWGAPLALKWASVEGKDKNELNMTRSSDIPTMDVSKTSNTESFLVITNTMEGLYRMDKEKNVSPGVALDHKVSEDGLTYTFNLRKDTTWSNGDPVTAKDFEFSWKRTIDPNTASEYAWIMYDIAGAEAANLKGESLDNVGVKAIDDYTLEVKLNRPVAYFDKLMSFTSFYPQNEKVFTEQGDKYGTTLDSVVYNGPFTLSTWKMEDQYALSKNPNYWDASTVKLDKVNVKITKDPNTDINLYEGKEIDIVGLNAEFVEKYKADPNFKTFDDASIFYLQINGGKNAKK